MISVSLFVTFFTFEVGSTYYGLFSVGLASTKVFVSL